MQKLGKETIGQKRTNKESEVFMIVRGNAMWASVFDKNTLSDKYQIDICNLDNKTVKELEKAGLKVKSGDGDKADKGSYIIAKSTFPPKVMDRRKSDRRANERRSDERRHHDRRSGSVEVAQERRQREELVELTDRRLTDRRSQDRREHDRRKINLLLNPEAQELLTKTPWMEELLVRIAEDQTNSAEDQNQPTPAS